MTAPLSLRVEAGGLLAALRAMDAAARDLTPVWVDVVRPSLSEFWLRQFDTSGAEGGTPWAPLRPSTLAYKARYNRAGMGILRFTNRLWGSLVKAPSPEGVEAISPESYVRGTAVVSERGFPYAVAHQHGYTISRWGRVVFRVPITVPARPLVPDVMPDKYVSAWADGIGAFIARSGRGTPP